MIFNSQYSELDSQTLFTFSMDDLIPQQDLDSSQALPKEADTTTLVREFSLGVFSQTSIGTFAASSQFEFDGKEIEVLEATDFKTSNKREIGESSQQGVVSIVERQVEPPRKSARIEARKSRQKAPKEV